MQKNKLKLSTRMTQKDMINHLKHILLINLDLQKQQQIKNNFLEITNLRNQIICKGVVELLLTNMKQFQIIISENKNQKEISCFSSIFKVLKIIFSYKRSQFTQILKEKSVLLHKQALFVVNFDKEVIKPEKSQRNVIVNQNQNQYGRSLVVNLLDTLIQLRKQLKIYLKDMVEINDFFGRFSKILKDTDKQKAIIASLLHYSISFQNQALMTLSQLLAQNNQHLLATTYLKMINYNQYDKRGLLNLSLLYKQLNQLNKAEFYLEQIFMHKYDDLCYKESLFQLGNIMISRGMFQMGRQKYKSCLKTINKEQNNESQLYYKVLLKFAYENTVVQRYDEAIQLIQNQLNSDQFDKMPQKILISCYFMLGNIYTQTKNLQKALYYFNKVYQNNKTDVILMKKIAHIYLLTSNFQLSIKFCQQILNLDPNNIQILTLNADNELQRGNQALCKEIIDKVKEINIKQVQSCMFYRQIILKLNGNNDISSTFLIQYELYQKQKAKRYFQLALKLKSQRRNSQSLSYLIQSYKLDKTNPFTLGELSLSFYYQNNHQKSLQYYKQMSQLQIDSEYCLQVSAFIHNAFNKYKQAQVYLQKLKNLYPQNKSYPKQYIINQINQQNRSKALDLIHQYLNNPQNIHQSESITFAIYMHKNGHYQLAMSFYEKIIQSHKDDESFLYKLFGIFQNIKPDYTLRIIRLLIAVNPYSYRYYYKLYTMMLEQHRSALEKSDFRVILASVNYLHEDCDVYNMIGNLYYKKKDYKRSFINIIKSLKIGDNYYALKLLQKLFKKQKYTQDVYLMKMIQIKPTNADLHQRMAKRYKSKAQTQKQIFHLQKITQYSNQKEKALMRLIQIYQLKKQTQKSILNISKLIQYQTYNIDLYEQLIKHHISRQQKTQALIYVNKMFHWCTYNNRKYEMIKQIYRKDVYQNRDETTMIKYMQNNYLNEQNRQDKYLLSFYYRYYNKFSTSLSYFFEYFKQNSNKLSKQTFKKQTKRSSDIILNIDRKDKDLYVKLIYLYYLINDQKSIISNLKKVLSKNQYFQLINQEKIQEKDYINTVLQQYKYTPQILGKIDRIIQPYLKQVIEYYITKDKSVKQKGIREVKEI